jgi:hypothetical protein
MVWIGEQLQESNRIHEGGAELTPPIKLNFKSSVILPQGTSPYIHPEIPL